MGKLKIYYLIVLIIILYGCGGASIEQKIEKTSCLKKETRIVTDVVIKDWLGNWKTIEYQTWLVISDDKVDSVKKSEYEKAIPYLIAARNYQ